jgi:hypothetical protein
MINLPATAIVALFALVDRFKIHVSLQIPTAFVVRNRPKNVKVYDPQLFGAGPGRSGVCH